MKELTTILGFFFWGTIVGMFLALMGGVGQEKIIVLVILAIAIAIVRWIIEKINFKF